MGTLFIVATPIGNLEDITIRALRALSEADIIACEDTRRTGQLLGSLQRKYPDLFSGREGKVPPLSYYDQNETQKIPQIISLLNEGKNVALVSDAGTPLISDPGFKLVRECIAQGVTVSSIPGPSSLINALVLAGLPTDKFLFLGYPPRKSGHRQAFYETIVQSWRAFKTTVVLFEAPHKLAKTLEEMQGTFGDIPVVLLREMTKVYEERREDMISGQLAQLRKKPPRGEFVLVLPCPF